MMVVNLCAAHKKTDLCAAHEVLLVCFLQSRSTRRWILYTLACFKGFMVYNYYSGLIRSIHHVKMQLNDAIKISVGIGHL